MSMLAQKEAWPPDYLVEFNKRFRLNRNLSASTEAMQSMITYYRHHPADWIKDWCVTFDPRGIAAEGDDPADYKPKLLPFVLFQRQREFVEFVHGCLLDKESGLTEKCRDIGATWLCCCISVWLWLFWDGVVVGWGSRKEEYVDKRGDPKAIFTKIRYIIDNLPWWQIPAGFDKRQHDNHMRLVNPANGNAITGEAGDGIGRGGRTTIYFKDESAHYERPELIEAALGDNTDVQIDISSVNGTANVFYRRRMAGAVWAPAIDMPKKQTRIFIFDWRDHPAKTQEWYEGRRKKAQDEGLLHIFAQEVDRDYAGSQERVVIPAEWARACIDAHLKLNFDDSGEIIGAQDVADGGGDKNAGGVRKGVVLRWAEDWAGEAGDAARYAMPIFREWGVEFVDYDCIGVGVGYREAVKQMTKEQKGKIKLVPWNAGGEVLDPEQRVIKSDKESSLNKDQYLNLKAQSWFRFRSRCYKTYRAVVHGQQFDPSELCSFDSKIPVVHALVQQLSQAKSEPAGNGKTRIEKKPEGSLSPNLADMVVILYNPIRPKVGFFDID